MKPKRFLCLLFALSLVFALSGCLQPAHQAESTTVPTSTITPLLYKVTDADGSAIWLFGSIHVGKDSFYPLPDYVNDAYHAADALAVECDVVAFQNDISAQTAVMEKMFYGGGVKISDHIPAELYNEAVAVMQDAGLYNSFMDYYRPSVWATLLDGLLPEKAGMDSNLGIDMHFLTKAHEENKEILEIESVEFQYDMLTGFSEPLQILLLESSVASAKNAYLARVALTALVNAWSSGDEEALVQQIATEGTFETAQEQQLYQAYYDAMYTSRNLAMTAFAENALKENNEVFICVGAAHVVGKGGMAKLLQNKGYQVEILSPVA